MSTISSGTTSNTAYIVSADTTGDLVLSPTNFLSATQKSLGTGRVPAEQFYALNTAVTGANATGAQSIFGVGVTLVGSTIYQFEAVISMSKTAGGVSYIMSSVFGGTATLNSITYSLSSTADITSFVPTASPTGITQMYIQAATAAIRPTSSAAALYIQYVFKGIVSVNAGGTFIPQYSLSAAPGGAFTVQAGSYFKISPLAASGSNVNIGSWA